MEIKTQETVQKTLALYRWNDTKGWLQDKFGTFHRLVHQRGDLKIFQKKWQDGRSIDIETPQLTLYISSGKHLDAFGSLKPIRFYSLNIETTTGEKNVYHSTIDEKGFKSIGGSRQLFLDFLTHVPSSYVALEKDEKGKYISSLWMNCPCAIMNKNKKIHLR